MVQRTILAEENHLGEISQVAIIDSSSPSVSGTDTRRIADRITNLTAKGEAHLENSQFADALDCFELALSLDSQSRQAQLGRNRAHCQIIPRWHFEMLNDEQRNAAFEQALRNAITSDTVVLDIGSGTGLLAMMAARAGAKQTFTCEMVPALAELARETVERNGLADRIVTLGKKSMSLVIGKQMMRKANLLVTETVDCGLLAEGIVASIAHAKANLLTEDAQIVPCGATVYAMVVESPRLRNLNSARTVAGFDVSFINRYAVAHYFPVRLGAFDYTPLTDPFEVFHFDFANGTIIPDRKIITVRAKRDGVGHCIVFWFNMRLDSETSISNEPGSTTHWEQALQCLDTEVAIRVGETMVIEAEHDCHIIVFNSCKAGLLQNSSWSIRPGSKAMSTLRSAVPEIADLDEGHEINGHTEPNFNIEMKLYKGYKGLYARKDIVAGSVIFDLKGRISRRGNKYSVQLSRDKHLDFPLIRKPNDDLDYAWQYVNHSCEPNGYVNAAEYSFSALRNIRKGEEITFNYLTTEYELAAPFQCECGSAKCFGSIRGYKFLTADQLAELLPVTSMTTSSK